LFAQNVNIASPLLTTEVAKHIYGGCTYTGSITIGVQTFMKLVCFICLVET